MPQTISQDDRLGKLHTPLGKDVLVLQEFSGTEAVNDPFGFSVRALCTDKTVNLDKVIGRNVTVELQSIAHGPRYFDGLLTGTRFLGVRTGGYAYELTLNSWFWLLDRRKNQRIFHNMTPSDILMQVFADYGYQAEIDADGLPTLEYTVQYGETDLSFVRRLMEKFGLNFYFTHAMGEHRLKVNAGRFSDEVPGSSRDLIPYDGQHRATVEHFSAWTANRAITPGRVKVTDYNFKTPNANLETNQSGNAQYAHNNLEIFDFPGGFLDTGGSNKAARLRLQQAGMGDNRHRAEGDAMQVSAGCVVQLKAKEHPLNGKSFIATRCSHSFVAGGFSSGGAGGGAGEDSYEASYEFAPKEQPLVPEKVTPRAVMHGPHLATVIGSGEIDSDEFGRITVKFPWDISGSGSMRCRVVQPWAGNSWGTMFIPRVGMEVVVQFIDGDPDFPLVIGSVYNGVNATPYPLPGKQNIGGMKSQSVGGGGYNEFIMDDTGGNELIRMHAQYNLDATVENNETRTVNKDRTTTIKQNDTENITETQSTTAKNKKADVNQSYEITSGQTYKVTVGAAKIEMSTTEIKLSVGASSITLNATGITVDAMEVKASAKTNLETSSMLTATHSATGIMTITGAMVKINS